MNPNSGIAALRKVAPKAVASMGYKKGGKVKMKGYKNGGLIQYD